ncbi:helix-turn-helix domain-containing protein [Streptomyces physcomitrii]
MDTQNGGKLRRVDTLGRLISELREAHQWSQSRLAAEIDRRFGTNLDRIHISRWENDRVRPGAFSLRRLSAVLDMPRETLEGDTKRHTFLTDVAGSAIAPLAASELLEAGFSARISEGPTAEEWEERLSLYGSQYMSLGAHDIRRRVSRELVLLQQQSDQRRLWSVAARLMTLYAKTFPGSDGEKAVRWYRLAAEAADHSEDLETRVWVRGRAAIALGYEGAALKVADSFGQQATEISDGRPSLGLLNALMGRAHAAAIRGNVKAAHHLSDQGRRVFDAAGSHEQASDYAVPHWRMNVFLSLLLARLGDERGAVEAQDAASAELPAELPRFATHLELHRGLMLARSGDKAGGAAYAQAAMDALPPERHSLTLRMLREEIRA